MSLLEVLASTVGVLDGDGEELEEDGFGDEGLGLGLGDGEGDGDAGGREDGEGGAWLEELGFG